jgi:hypothetical protein
MIYFLAFAAGYAENEILRSENHTRLKVRCKPPGAALTPARAPCSDPSSAPVCALMLARYPASLGSNGD